MRVFTAGTPNFLCRNIAARRANNAAPLWHGDYWRYWPFRLLDAVRDLKLWSLVETPDGQRSPGFSLSW